MTHKQTCIRFQHPCGTRTSSQWRQGLLQDQSALLEDVVVYQSSTALSFTARTPEAAQRMSGDALGLMRAVAGLAGRALTVEMLEFTPSVAVTGYRWSYEVPRLAVARSGEDWAVWRESALPEPQRDKLRERIHADLSYQLKAWGLVVPDLAITIEDDGVPMPLKDAVFQGPRPTSAMARKQVRFSSAARIEGAFWAGLLQATGHGRIYRDGYQDKE